MFNQNQLVLALNQVLRMVLTYNYITYNLNLQLGIYFTSFIISLYL